MERNSSESEKLGIGGYVILEGILGHNRSEGIAKKWNEKEKEKANIQTDV